MVAHLHRRGTWEPAALINVDLWALLTGLIVVASLRGADYATGEDGGRGISVVEAAFPLTVWAALILTGAALLTIGIALRAHAAVWAGHLWLSAVYLALGVGVWLSAIEQPWWDGFRSAGDLLLFGAIHLLVGIRTGPRPDEDQPGGAPEDAS